MSSSPAAKRWIGRRGIVAALIGALLSLALSAVSAQAAEEVKNHEFRGPFIPGKLLDDPCGLAVSSQGDVFVSDYGHDQIGRRDHLPPNAYGSLIENVAPSNGPCGLAFDAADNLYVNYFHGAVVRYAAPGYASATVIDQGHATGVAVDKSTGDLYVDERTSIAVYEAPVNPGPPTSQIGLGSLENGYGVAVSEADGRVYVPDAATHTVKVYGPAEPAQPESTIDGAGTAAGKFVSLVNAGLAIDQSNDHLFVADNTQPGFEHPRAAVAEFTPAGIFRGELAHAPTDGAPVGIAVNESAGSGAGEVYVTTGNGQSDVLGEFDPEQASSLLAFGPAGLGQALQVTRSGAGQGSVKSSPAGIACPGACEAELNSGALITLTATPAPGSVFAGWSGACTGTAGSCQVSLTAAATVDAAFAPAPTALAMPSTQAITAPAAIVAAEVAPAAKKSNRARHRFARGKAIVLRAHHRSEEKR